MFSRPIGWNSRSAIGQEAAKAYLTSITTVESLALEPKVDYPIPAPPHENMVVQNSPRSNSFIA